MKNFLKYSLTFLFALSLGLLFVFILYFSVYRKDEIKYVSNMVSGKAEASKTPDHSKSNSEDKVNFWLEDEKFSYKGFTITNICVDEYVADYEQCKLKLMRNGEVIQEFVNYKENSLRYGFFNLIGKQDKQLILSKIEGGSCSSHTYLIYDLQPKLRLIYDSREFRKEREYINFDLTPIDIDKDGVFEFTQSVHTFDYFYASHGDSIYPTAVFSYDKKLGKYKFANKKFSKFIVKKLKEDFNLSDSLESIEEYKDKKYLLRKIFLELVYSGEKDEGWEFFDENYDFEDKEEFAKDLVKELNMCPLYQDLYQVRCANKIYEMEYLTSDTGDSRQINLLMNHKLHSSISLPDFLSVNGFSLNWVKKHNEGFEISIEYGSRIYYSKQFNFVCKGSGIYLNKINIESFDKHEPEKWNEESKDITPFLAIKDFSLIDNINN